MSATLIEWTHRPGTVGETWNPTTGCNKVDRGCKHCYAEIMHRRLMAMGQEKYQQPFLDGAVPHPDTLEIPYSWRKPRTVFVNSMSDLFHKDVPFEFIDKVFQVMERTPQHTYLVLTKRPGIALEYWSYKRNPLAMGNPGWKCPPNLWMGTSANDQKSANERVPVLLALDGCLLFLSYEPATGPVALTELTTMDGAIGVDALNGIRKMPSPRGIEFKSGRRRLDWVLCGGESGPKADPMHPAWARKVRDDCKAAGVPFFFKQQGSWEPITYRTEGMELSIRFNLGKGERLMENPLQNMVRAKKKSGNLLDGQTYLEFPDPTKIPRP